MRINLSIIEVDSDFGEEPRRKEFEVWLDDLSMETPKDRKAMVKGYINDMIERMFPEEEYSE